jgi:hypothetical protein
MLLKHFPVAVTKFGVGGALKLFTSRRRLRPWLPEWTQDLAIDAYPHRFHSIELHDAEGSEVFFRCVSPFPAHVRQYGEVTFWERRSERLPSHP